MVLLTRNKQVAAVEQTSTALASGLTTASNASLVVLDAQISPEIEQIERNLTRESLTAVQNVVGQKMVEFTFGVEFIGVGDGSHANGAPLWGRLLKGCGFREVEVQSITIGAISATGDGSSTTFRHGETITQATTGATATVVRDTHNGTTTLLIEKASITGSPNSSNIWTGGDSGASATPSTAPADEGFAWYPITHAVKSITFDGTGLTSALSVGDVIRGTTSGAIGVVFEAVGTGAGAVVKYRPERGTFANAETLERLSPTATADIGDLAADRLEVYVDWPPLSMARYLDGKRTVGRGCRGSVVLNFEVNRQGRMDFTFRGSLDSVTDTPLVAGVQYETALPPIWESSTIGFARNDALSFMDAADEIAPCLRTLSLDLGVGLSDRRCAGAADGLLEVIGATREGTGSMDVDDTLEADAGWISRVLGGEVARLGWTLGSTDGRRFSFSAPGLQFTGASEGDEDGRATQSMDFRLTGGDLFDLDSGATGISSFGGDNEVVIVYHTA